MEVLWNKKKISRKINEDKNKFRLNSMPYTCIEDHTEQLHFILKLRHIFYCSPSYYVFCLNNFWLRDTGFRKNVKDLSISIH